MHQQQPPYWNAAQTALLHNAMAGGAHIPLQQGMHAHQRHVGTESWCLGLIP